MCMSLQRIDITYLGKKLFFKFLGTNCVMPKSGHQGVKQPVLGPVQKTISVELLCLPVPSPCRSMSITGAILLICTCSFCVLNI